MAGSLLRIALFACVMSCCHGSVADRWKAYAESGVGQNRSRILFWDWYNELIDRILGNGDNSALFGTGDGIGALLNSTDPPIAELMYEWTTLKYDFPKGVEEIFLEYGEFIPNTNWIAGVQVYKDEVYVTAPRVKYVKGTPSGLNKVVVKDGQALLQPFPDLSFQKLGRCSALQLPTSKAIDPNTGYMYIIDTGRAGVISASPGNFCPAKIVVLDLNDNGRVVRSHDFPDSVVSNTSNFLNDIVLDYVTPDGSEVRYAYISDTGDANLVVFDFQTNTSWAFKDTTMTPAPNGILTINDVNYTMDFPINGIGMSPNFDYVYYCVIGNNNLYQIPTSVLRNKTADFKEYVRNVGDKGGSSDAIVVGKKNLYFGVMQENAVSEWQRSKDIKSQNVSEGEVNMATIQELTSNDVTMQWPDGFTLDDKGYLWFTTERLQLYLNDKMDFSGGQGSNFRVFRMFVGDVSYLTKPTSGKKSWWEE
ncbi:major royal jelly protein 1 [Aplysia californica]|uniref:Major royal jelly protein 1 n=1 Tax=Aplysia californica TaxID=6500 RepID=A0ABM0JYK6_APLCA|nr:major royal jelly protein 1 [Aplysia californica]